MSIIGQLAFPSFERSPAHPELTLFDGSLFDLPQRARSDECIKFYKSIKIGGWSTCPAGYAVYTYFIEEEHFLVFPGLRVSGVSNISGKTVGLTIRTDRAHIENYVRCALDARAEAIENARRLIRRTIHEIRGLNSISVNAAQELDRHIQYGTDNHEQALVGNILATANILSAHLDVVSFIANPDAEWLAESIAVYRKFDKLVRCFRPRAARLGITLELIGQSHGLIRGPGMFEIVPFLALDNAVKYAPKGSRVEVLIEEDNGGVRTRVESIGPRLDDDEHERIFMPGFRGRNAELKTKEGDGEGLALLKDLVERLYKGKIEFHQDNGISNVDRIPHSQVVLRIDLPLLRYDE